ncbi:unnamed protein product [Cunninghamella blakesleeana]
MVKLTTCLIAAFGFVSTIQALPSSLDKRGILASSRPITNCKNKNDIALTFDDGPYAYTSGLLDLLVKEKIPATFFINGNNFWVGNNQKKIAPVLQKAYKAGFEIASHTYTHPNLNTLSNAQIKKQMQDNEKIIYNAIKKYPAVMRPPFGESNNKVTKLLNSYGYTVVNWSIDTEDTVPGTTVTSQYNHVKSILDANKSQGHIVLAHDVS